MSASKLKGEYEVKNSSLLHGRDLNTISKLRTISLCINVTKEFTSIMDAEKTSSSVNFIPKTNFVNYPIS